MTLETPVTTDSSTGHGEFTIELPGLPQYASTARMFASAVARHFACAEEDIEDLKLAISEAVALATRAAGAPAVLRMTVRTGERTLVFTIEHESGFDAMLPGGEVDNETELGVAVIESLFPDIVVDRTTNGGCMQLQVPR